MNWNQIEAKWKQFKGSIKEKWGKFTDDDVDVIEGKRERLVGKIQEKYACRRDEAERQIDDFAKNCECQSDISVKN